MSDERADDTPDVPTDPVTGCPVQEVRGQRAIHVPRDRWQQAAEALRDAGYLMCVDVTAVDYLNAAIPRTLPPGVTPERFEVVAHFRSRTDIVRMRTQVPVDDPTIGTLVAIYPSTNFMEREVYDLFGVVFEGHPDLARLLLPDDWVGHPLRKDEEIGAIPVQFKHGAN